MVRVSNTGISGIIDSDGNVLKKLNLNEYGIDYYELNLNPLKQYIVLIMKNIYFNYVDIVLSNMYSKNL